MEEQEGFRSRILREMTVDHHEVLERNFDVAQKYIRITQDGRVELLNKKKLTGTKKILLYHIGKYYCEVAGLCQSPEVSTVELTEELVIPQGSLFPWLKALRDKGYLKSVHKGNKVYHVIALNVVEHVLNDINPETIER